MGGGYLSHALIGLAPYFLHYDSSKTFGENSWLAVYAAPLNDLRNFWLPVGKYRSLFRKEYLNSHLPIEDVEIDCVMPFDEYSSRIMNWLVRIDSRKRIDVWKDRSFPDTRAENLKIFDDYLTLCEKNKILPIMFLPPMTEGYKKYFNKQKLDEFFSVVQDALQKHKTAKFFNGWALQGFIDTDFLDVDHLNLQGAEKFSVALNDFIEKI